MLEVLDETESKDLSNIELDNVFHRYEKLNGLTTKPETMKVYRQRINKAVTDFISYNEDPTNWKPSGGQRNRTLPTKVIQPKAKNAKSRVTNTNRPVDDGVSDRVSSIMHRFPLREDIIVSVTGIPFDVTRLEMGRLTAYLSNLVAVSSDGDVPKPMLNSGSRDA